MKADLSEYRCPDATYKLLCQWGAMAYLGAPRLGYPNQAAVVGEYLAPRIKQDEAPTFDMDEFERLCHIIDVTLSKPKTDALLCKFRYSMKAGKRFTRRDSATYMGIKGGMENGVYRTAIEKYENLLRSALRTVDINLNGESDD